jgi:hypothetical protein
VWRRTSRASTLSRPRSPRCAASRHTPPRARFLELLEATYARFPDCPPYEGLFDEPEPHLTIGEATETTTTEEILAAARALEPSLPLPFRVDGVWLLEELQDGTWATATRFPLA